MKKTIKKAGALLVAAAMLAGLSACGKDKAAETGDGYEYVATFQDKTFDLKNGYMMGAKISGDILYSVETRYSEDLMSSSAVLHTIDLAAMEDKSVDLDSQLTDGKGYLGGIIVGDSDTFYVVKETWKEDTGEENMDLYEIGADGKVRNKTGLGFLTEDGNYMNPDNMQYAGNGRFIAATMGSLKSFNTEGRVLSNESVGDHIISLSKGRDGKIYCQYFMGGEMNLGIVNSENGQVDAIGKFAMNGSDIYVVNDELAFIKTDTGVKEYNIKTGETRMLWNWLDTDIDDGNVLSIGKNDDGTYKVITTDQSQENKFVISVADLKYQKVTAESAKQTIVYGCLDLDWDVKKAIQDFNKHSESYRIKVKAYGDQYEDYTQASDMFKADVAAGKQIDVFSVDGYDFERFSQSKMLADIGPLFDRDLNRADFFENVLDIYKKDGKQFGMPVSFGVNTLIVSKDTAAGRTSWSFEDIMELRKANPDKTFLQSGDRLTAFYSMVYYMIGDFVDYAKGECNFQSKEFYDLLEFAKTFPEEFNYEDYDSWGAFINGDCLIADLSIWSPDEFQLYDSLLGGEAVLIGYPTTSGSGNRVNASTVFAVSSKSKNIEGAWEFIKSFLSEDFQKENWRGLPMIKSAYDAKVKDLMNRDGGGSYGNGYTTVEINKLTQAQADKIKEAIEGATGAAYFDEKIVEIMSEEVDPYFKGQKSAEDVASVLQSRISLYLQEQK